MFHVYTSFTLLLTLQVEKICTLKTCIPSVSSLLTLWTLEPVSSLQARPPPGLEYVHALSSTVESVVRDSKVR